MYNLNEVTGKNTLTNNPQYPYNPTHPYNILIIGGSGTGTIIALPNLMSEEHALAQIYLYVIDLSGRKYQHLIKTRVTVGKKHFTDSSTFTEHSNDIHDIYENIDFYKK